MLSLNDLTGTYKRTPGKESGIVASFIADIGPNEAETVLLKNSDLQRRISSTSVNLFVEAQKQGQFFDGGAIRFVWDGKDYRLVDGQHRMEAVAKSGIAAKFVVVVVAGDERNDYSKQDQYGRKRSLRDAVFAVRQSVAEGMVNNRLVAYVAALKIIAVDFSDNESQFVAGETFYKLFDEYLDAREIIESAPKMPDRFKTRGIYKAPVYAVALATARYAEKRTVQDFWGQVVDDNGLMQNDPRKKLNRFLNEPSVGNGGSKRTWNRIAATKCWNAFVNNKPGGIKQLKLTGKRIKIAFTPFPSDGVEDSD